MKIKLLTYIFFIIIITFSCKNIINNDKNLYAILIENDCANCNFTLYNYTNEQLYFTNFKEYKDSIYSINEFANFLSSIILIDKGIIFNEKTNYKFFNDEINLKKATIENNNSFFNYYLNSIPKKDLFNFIESLNLTKFLSKDTSLNNYHILFNMSLSLDQILGFYSKFYFKKIQIQERTYDICKLLLNKQNSNKITLTNLEFAINNKNKYIQLGSFEKNSKPFFYILLLNKKTNSENTNIILSKLFNYLKVYS